MAEEINKDMTFQDVLQKKPESGQVFMKYGLHCIGCHLSAAETVEQGSKGHALSDDQIDQMITEINALD